MNLERNFKLKVTDDLKALNGEEFERFSRYILELILNEKVIHKGQNLFAKPVGYTADFADNQYEIIGQSGTDEGYFDDFNKPFKDVKGALKNHSTAKIIYLLTNRYAGTSRLGDLVKEAKTRKIKQTIIPFDSERIAEIILDKILASHIVDEIFKYLPSAFELYKILPKTSQIPSHKDTYYERVEEDMIIKQLDEKSVTQVYGLSGIGKTEITIGIAQKLSKKYDTIIWIDGDSVQNSIIDFNAIKISKFDKLINLSTILETYCVCVIFDNVNHNTQDVFDAFLNHNKKDSKCLISSLSKSLSEEYSFELNEVSDEIARKILFGSHFELDENKSKKILTYVGKHPLILKIIHSVIKNSILDWDSLVLELEDINRLTDKDRNQTISNRIIGRIKQSNEKELASIKFIGHSLIAYPIIEKLIGKIGVNKLLDNSVLGKDDKKYYRIHQIVLDSIKTEIITSQWDSEFSNKVKEYLIEHNEIKDIGFYNVIFNHKPLFEKILSNTQDVDLKRIIVYSIIQCTDIKNTTTIDSLIYQASALINDNNTYYENLLSIELAEMALFKIDKKVEKEKYVEQTKINIEELNKMLSSAFVVNHKSTIVHHIGKFYFKIGEDKKALEKFEEVLTLKPNDPFALLQIARLSGKSGNIPKVTEITKYIFSLSDCPLSILLSFYELISYNNYADLKKNYIDENIDAFIAKIIEAIDSRYDQPYNILAKNSRHLAYNFKEHFEYIIENFPTPSNIDFNENLRFNYALILSSYYKFGNPDKQSPKMKKALSISSRILSEINLENDYKKGIYVDLLISNEEFDKALIEILKFEYQNEFYYQKLSKIYFGQKHFEKAIKAADDAIITMQSSGKEVDAYEAAFLNDKAEAENALNILECINTLKKAIEKQPNAKTKDEWNEKLNNWISNYGS